MKSVQYVKTRLILTKGSGWTREPGQFFVMSLDWCKEVLASTKQFIKDDEQTRQL